MSYAVGCQSEFNNPDMEVLIDEVTLKRKIAEIGAAITRDYAGRVPHLICVLKGAVVFLSELVRAIDLPVTLDFIAVSSYGDATRSSGEVRIVKDLDASPAGRDVIVVEDILDTGLTLNYLLNNIRAREVNSVCVAVLLNKPSRRVVDVEVAYKGFDIPDAFVIGYGLDCAERYRNLPYVGVLKKSDKIWPDGFATK
ncbi:MAG: hypoxanthine phosphoribosyltransferase [Acidobacteria bacterium]|nr:hypoxanthine phosphoribosyltransferase [Acidobacteriota bacterium]